MFFGGVYFSMCYLAYFIDWNIIRMNGTSIIISFLFYLISLLFMDFVFTLSTLVI